MYSPSEIQIVRIFVLMKPYPDLKKKALNLTQKMKSEKFILI